MNKLLVSFGQQPLNQSNALTVLGNGEATFHGKLTVEGDITTPVIEQLLTSDDDVQVKNDELLEKNKKLKKRIEELEEKMALVMLALNI